MLAELDMDADKKQYYHDALDETEAIVKGSIGLTAELGEKANRELLARLPLVLSHNDVYWGNMLLETEAQRVHIIDFELTSVNYLGGDLAQLLGELMMDYDKEGDSFSPEDLPCVEDLKELVKVLCFFFYQKGALERIPGGPDLRQRLRADEEYQAFSHESVGVMCRALPLLKKMNDLFWIWRAFYIYMAAKDSDVDYLNLVKERGKIMQAKYPDISK